MGKNVFADEVPENYWNQTWMGNNKIFPQKIRIAFSCPKMISSVNIRNSRRSSYYNTKDFEIKVREPNSTRWTDFISGTLPYPFAQNPAPLETFNGTAVIAKEIEFSCLSTISSTWYSNRKCALNFIGFA